MHGNWNDNMHDGFGWGWLPMGIMMLLVWGSLIWLGVTLLRRSGTHYRTRLDVLNTPRS